MTEPKFPQASNREPISNPRLPFQRILIPKTRQELNTACTLWSAKFNKVFVGPTKRHCSDMLAAYEGRVSERA